MFEFLTEVFFLCVVLFLLYIMLSAVMAHFIAASKAYRQIEKEITFSRTAMVVPKTLVYFFWAMVYWPKLIGPAIKDFINDLRELK